MELSAASKAGGDRSLARSLASHVLRCVLQAVLGGNANPTAGDINKILGSGEQRVLRGPYLHGRPCSRCVL